MAMMAKMRSLAPAFIITVGGIFVLFMVLSDSRVLEIFGQRQNNVGSINGTDISYQQYSALLEQAKERQKAQTGQDIDEDQMDAFNDQVWETMVNQELIKEQIEKFGIKVSDEEVREIIFGANPPDFLRSQFTDSTGRFNRQLYTQTLMQQKKDVLLAIEEQVRQMRLNEKLESYLFASINVGEGQIKRRYIDQAVNMNAQYVSVDVNTIADNQVRLTEEDMKKYYEANLNDFKVDAQRKLKYVVFPKTASKQDSAAVQNNLAAIVQKLKTDTTSFKSYVGIYSEMPYSKDTLKQNMLTPAASSLLASAAPGSIVGPVASYEGYSVYKLIAKAPSKETFVRAAHILIPFGQDENAAKAKAEALYNRAKGGEDFAKLARENSTDFASAKNGGDLGYFGKGQMVKEFEDAAFGGTVGQVVAPVKTSYGYHVIKITGKSANDFVVERIVNRVKASGSTVEEAFSKAGDFQYLADKNDFEGEAKIMNYKVMESPAFNEDSYGIPGIGANKALVQFAFDGDLNDISEVYKTPAGYVVAKITEIVKPGVRKFEEVKASVRQQALREKKMEKARDIAGKILSLINSGQSFEQAISGYAQYAKTDTTGNFTAQSGVPSIGRDFAFIDNALKLPVNKVSAPIKGYRGYYIVKLIAKNPFSKAAYAIQRNSVRDNLMQEKKSYFFSQWLQQLKKDAKIVDNRRLFFR